MTFMCSRLYLPEDIPDASSDDNPCCAGRAIDGPRACTCWVEVFSRPQVEVRPGMPQIPIPVRPCADCAYRAGSPEREGRDGYGADADDLERLAATETPFYCHDGMVYLIGLAHPAGVAYSPKLGDYRPPKQGGVPYRADGSPGFLCAGWLLRAAVIRRQREEPSR